MRCSVCQYENRTGVKFCEQCGNKLVLVCPGCGARLLAGSNFCGECGHPLGAELETSMPKLHTESQRKRVTVLFSDMAGFTTLSDRLDPEEVRDMLIAPYFKMEALPQTEIKGISQPIVPYRVLEESSVQSRFESSKKKGFTAFAGRDEELVALYACLEKAEAGKGQFVSVVGEAGLGKSRLLYKFQHSINRDQILVHCPE